ncbi:hypothetical protein Tmel_1358 [Thermosipho melanesiensis BI429]|uniref:Adhesin domain-containing protein n=2 Tax=Thermosipho melanesiensis TaxID=46541 RepID=A6LMQ5_THEM4|nr:hypothetical protein Tmel_1358 [Thermosipho melanesiensis BI429]
MLYLYRTIYKYGGDTMDFVKAYPITSKIIALIILGILSIVIPFWSVKIIIFVISVFLFGTILKNAAIGFIILVLIFSFPFLLENVTINFIPNFFNPVKKETINPNRITTLNYEEVSIKFENANLILHLIDGNNIEYPDELNITQENNKLKISINIPKTYKVNKYYVIKIGNSQLKSLKINTNSTKILGNASLENLEISSTGIDLENTNIKSSYIKLDGTGINLRGNIESNILEVDGTGININGILSGKIFKVDGTGINIKGKINYNSLVINGTGMNLNFNVGNSTDSIELSGTSINGDIDLSNSNSYFTAYGTSGNVKVKNYKNATLNVKGVKLTLEQE